MALKSVSVPQMMTVEATGDVLAAEPSYDRIISFPLAGYPV